jgi:OFA family oxalate/formate antiporter-like MFS transporter
MRTNNRWVIAIAGVFFQIALGAVYAWSVFRVPLTKQFGWSISEVTLTFTISIFVLGCSAFFGGLWLNRKGPRIVALTGGALYGLGVFLASFTHSLAWLYISYGLIGGIGLGLGYIVPVAVLVKWFPDKRGLITGIAVGGFGAGALITAPVATRLIQTVGVLSTFAYLGIAYLIVTMIAGMFLQNPPDGWQLEGWKPSALQTSQRAGHDFVLSEALRTWQWWALWLLLFLNTCAGISVISQEAPIFQELTKVSAVVAGSMVGIASLGNAVGRVFWAWVSDLITRRFTFLVMFIFQVLLFWFFPTITTASLMTIVTFVVLMCYGGGFGTMPATAGDFFGVRHAGAIYGLMLVGWSLGGIIGPLVIAALIGSAKNYTLGYTVIALIALAATSLTVITKIPRTRQDAHEGLLGQEAA